ncbi:Conserved_hypothetical protein [Hexamita inflata]|uniref:Transmembrane protein n=1 Tax=Hexamita inflata TaxID=28002 RepID=A0AA86NWV1_9EUKA|nr:Conserved hypothetical protein [Hexamita inflata]
MIFIFCQTQKILQLQSTMKQFEADNLNIQEFQSVYEIINQANKTYYSAVVQLFPDYQDNYNTYSKRGIKPKWFVTTAVEKLKLIIDTGNQTEKTWASLRLSALLSQQPNTELFFINKRQNSFTIYQQVIDQLTAMAANITSSDNESQIRAKIGSNNTYFTVNNYSQLHSAIPFTNPTIFETTSKDVIFVFRQFSSPQVLMKTLYETCSLYDRIWIYNIVNGDLVNVLSVLFERKYLSIIQIQNNQDLIVEYLNNNKEIIHKYVKIDFIKTIQNAIDDENANISYQIVHNNVKTITKSFSFIFFLTRNTLFTSNQKLEKQNNMQLLMISEHIDQSFNSRFDELFDLILHYKSYDNYLQQLKYQIVQHLKNYLYNDQIAYSMVNYSLLFLKPVYFNQSYIGTIYKIIQYENVDWNNDVNWYDQVSRNIILDPNGRVLISRFIQPNPPYFKDKYGQMKYYPQLTLPVLNYTLFSVNQTGLIKTIHAHVYEYSFNTPEFFTKKDFVVYLIQNNFKEHRGITSISNKALSMMFRIQFKQCDQDLLEVTNQKQKYYIHKSSNQINLTQLRSFAHIVTQSDYQNCLFQIGTIHYNASTVCSASYLNIRGLIQQYSVFVSPTPECSFTLPSGFQIHFGYEQLFDNVLNMNTDITGNVTQFIQTMQQAYQLVSHGKYNEVQILLQNYIKQKQTYGTYTTYLNMYVLKYASNSSDINLNTPLSNKIQTEIPVAVVDLMNRLDDISMFGQATYNLINLTSNKDILEVQLGHISHDSQEVILINDYIYTYNSYLEQNPQYLNDTIVNSRINVFKEAWSYYQLHYFTYSSGIHWKEIMHQQLKAQPEGKKGKYRIGNIDGKLAVTKALVVTNKNIDKETGVNGFLTVVLNKNFNIGIQENYTLLDENARFIHGINEEQYIFGIRQLLLQYGYLQKVRINATINDYNDIYELNVSFWDDALNRADNDEFTLVITSQNNIVNNYLSEQEYNNSEIHQRSVIFNVKSQYFYGGHIIVSQYGAIEGILIVYQNVVVNNYNIDQQILNDQTINVNKLEQLYQNLAARTNKLSQTFITQKVQNQRTALVLSSFEKGLLLFISSIPLFILCYLISVLQLNRQRSIIFDYQIYNDEAQYVQQNPVLNKQLTTVQLVKTNSNYSTKQLYTLKKGSFLTKLHLLKKRNYIFEDDYKTYDNRFVNEYIKNIEKPFQIFSYILKNQMFGEHLYVSFQLLTSQQHYFMILNQLKQENKQLCQTLSQSTQITGNMQVFNQSSSIKRPKVKSLNQNVNSNSFSLSNSQSNNISSISLPQLISEPTNYYNSSPVLYDMYEFFNRMCSNSFVNQQKNFISNEQNIEKLLNVMLIQLLQLSIVFQ